MKNKKRSASEEKEKCGTLKDTKKALSVDVLRQASPDDDDEEDDVTLVDHPALASNGKGSPSGDNDSFRSINGTYADSAASTTSTSLSRPHHYVTLTPDCEREESLYEDSSRSTTRKIMKDTLDLVLMKTFQFLRCREGRDQLEKTRCSDWDILSEVPFSFESEGGRRFEIFAASLKADPVKAYCLMVLPKFAAFDMVR